MIDLGLFIVGVGEYIQIVKAGSKIARWCKKASTIEDIVDIIGSNSIIQVVHLGLPDTFFKDYWSIFHNLNLIKGNSVSLFHSLNRDLFSSIYREWNTTIGDVGEDVGNTMEQNYKSKVEEITNYLNELKSYFDNENGIIY